MKILFISHTANGGSFVVGSHHLARNLVKLGHSVIHMSPPVTPAHITMMRHQFERERIRRWLKNGVVLDGVVDLVAGSLLPWAFCRIGGNPHVPYGRTSLGSALRLLKNWDFLAPDIIFIDEPRLAYWLNAFSKARIVYRPTDLYSEIRNDPTIILAEKAVIERAHAVIATSEPVASHVRRLGASNVLLLENGVDFEHFYRAHNFSVEKELPPLPRAVYAGSLDQRFGVESLAQAAHRNTGVSFVLIGPVQKLVKDKLKKFSNVSFLGAIPYERLPSYLRHCQIALLPLSDDPSNQGRSPMKLFEYAALGLPVVASATDELKRRNLPFVGLANTPDDFSEMVRQLIFQDNRASEKLAVEYALTQTWAAKTQVALAHALGQTL